MSDDKRVAQIKNENNANEQITTLYRGFSGNVFMCLGVSRLEKSTVYYDFEIKSRNAVL